MKRNSWDPIYVIKRLRQTLILALVAVAVGATPQQAAAQMIVPPFAGSYSLVDLGPVPVIPPGVGYGGLTLVAGDPNGLLIGAFANRPDGAIVSIGVVRGADNHITGFVQTPDFGGIFAFTPFIDGGLAYGPSGVLFYTRFPSNEVGEVKPGSIMTDKVVDLNPLGVASSVGALTFVPAGFPGAGNLKIVSYDGDGFYSATLAADGSGTFDITSATLETMLASGSGPEGIAYVPPGSPVFVGSTMLIAEFNPPGKVSAYQLDVNGIPIPATRQDFITGVLSAEGAFFDPLTNDFLFSFLTEASPQGLRRVLQVRGFAAPGIVPEPGTLTLCSLGLLGLAHV